MTAKVTEWFNILSVFLFIIGVIFFIDFAANNLGEKLMRDKKVSNDLQKGYVPPPPPAKPQPIEKVMEGVISPQPPLSKPKGDGK